MDSIISTKAKHATAYMGVYVCVSLFACVWTRDVSPTSPPALIPDCLPQIPIGDRAALEFIPHHPAEL